MNHFGRLAARVVRPNARQPGPALRSDSPIADHDQRLTSFSVVPVFGSAHDAGDELEEIVIGAQPDPGPPIGAPAVAPIRARRTETSGESAGLSGAGATVRPSPARASEAEPAREPMATSSSASSRPAPSAGIAESLASGSRGADGAGRLPGDAPPSSGAQTVAALASAFARVQAWMAAPVAPRPSRLAGAPSAVAQIPEVATPAGVDSAAPPSRAVAMPRRPHALAAPVPATTFADGRDARGGLPSLSPSAAAPLPPSRGLEIGHLSVEVVPPPASPPVSREPAARRPQRPEVGGFENSAHRRGTVARLGFGMRHW